MIIDWLTINMRKLIESNVRSYNKLKSYVADSSMYLIPGKYKIFFSDKIFIFRENQHNFRYINTINKTIAKQLKEKLIKVLLSAVSIKISHNSDSEYKGDILMPTHAGNVKIFNLEQGVVTYRIKKAEDYWKYLHTINTFKEFFNIPAIKFDAGEKIVVERLLNYTLHSDWSEKTETYVLNIIMESFRRYYRSIKFSNAKSKKIALMLQELRKKTTDQEFISIIEKFIPEDKRDEEFAAILCHGDFSLKNVLFCDNEIHVIDWEYSGDCIFYYDIMNLYLKEAQEGNYRYIQEYLNGNYDNYFVEYFEIFNQKFSSVSRAFYLIICIADRLTNLTFSNRRQASSEMTENYKKMLKSLHLTEASSDVIL